MSINTNNLKFLLISYENLLFIILGIFFSLLLVNLLQEWGSRVILTASQSQHQCPRDLPRINFKLLVLIDRSVDQLIKLYQNLFFI